MEDNPIFAGLNEAQQRAVATTEGPLLIFAGAGSGKTRVIVHRVAHLIEQGVRPAEILCLTFTNKAASELKQRLEGMLGHERSGVWAGTFHSFGAWFLRHEAHQVGFPRSFVIYDAPDQKSLVGKCIKELNYKQERGMDNTISWLNGLSKDTGVDPAYLDHDLPFDPTPVIDLYESRKKQYGAFDFGDLLSYPGRMLEEMPELASKYQGLFRYILVDEYQDTNTAQYRMLMGLVGPERNICVVGDDDQSIYGWRGADVGNILRFKDDFPGAEVVILDQNYRSTQGILDAAAMLIKNNRTRAPKKLRANRSDGQGVRIDEYPDAGDEAAHVAWRISRLISDGVSPAEIGVFYRVNALSRQVEESFVRQHIPYAVYGGMRFYERREIRDVMAYLRLLANPGDEEAFSRVVNVPVRGIGPKSLAGLQTFARSKGQNSLESIEEAVQVKAIKGKAARGAEQFLGIMRQLSGMAGAMDLGDLIRNVMTVSGMETALAAEVDGQDRITNVRELQVSAEGTRDLQTYLEEKALMNPVDNIDGESVSVMTLHMSKGLEFDHVFILGLEEGILPHSRSLDTTDSIEEERRLLYVGITRARLQAFLSWSRVRALYGRENYQIPSAFINELNGLD